MLVPSHLKEDKVKICKCGHLRQEHKDNPDSKYSFPKQCQKCQCSVYMNRKLPNKFSQVFMIFGLISIGFFIFNSVFVYELGLEVQKKTVTIPLNDLILISIGSFTVVALMMFNNAVYPYFQEKKRRSYPIENKGELT
jgi:hypothetical protein